MSLILPGRRCWYTVTASLRASGSLHEQRTTKPCVRLPYFLRGSGLFFGVVNCLPEFFIGAVDQTRHHRKPQIRFHKL